MVTPSSSQYAHPLVAVTKADGSIRLCTDLRLINSGTINDSYPSVLQDELLMRVSRSRFISTLDCVSGYWQVPIKAEDQHKTAFHSPRGLLEWKVLPFGLKTASQTYQRLMDIILSPHTNYSASYIDDTIVFSDTWEEHLQHLSQVIEAFRKANMTLKLKKCHFAKDSVQFLGHRIGNGILTIPEIKIAPILSIPEPNTKSKLRSFLGMCGFYRQYIPNFATISYPLTELTKKRKSNQIVFTEQERNSFIQLKDSIKSASNLHSPDYTKPFIIKTDASDYGLGGVIAQLDENQQEKPIAFTSAKLKGAQLKWSTIEKESYAIIHLLNKYDYMLFGNEIILYTDHSPLTYIKENAPSSSKLTRWALSLSRYNITIKHISGHLNTVADCLSRCLEE